MHRIHKVYEDRCIIKLKYAKLSVAIHSVSSGFASYYIILFCGNIGVIVSDISILESFGDYQRVCTCTPKVRWIKKLIN